MDARVRVHFDHFQKTFKMDKILLYNKKNCSGGRTIFTINLPCALNVIDTLLEFPSQAINLFIFEIKPATNEDTFNSGLLHKTCCDESKIQYYTYVI